MQAIGSNPFTSEQRFQMQRDSIARDLRPVENFTKGWRASSKPLSTTNLPKLGSVVIRRRANGSLLLIRVLAVTAALDANFAGFTGVYCDRDGKPVQAGKGPRFYGSRKLVLGEFYAARQNHKRPLSPVGE